MKDYFIKVERVGTGDTNTVRVYGSFDGYSVIRYTDNQIVLDGKVVTKKEFENWLFHVNV